MAEAAYLRASCTESCLKPILPQGTANRLITSVAAAAANAQIITGLINWARLIPPAFSTVISLSPDSLPKARRTASRNAMGIVSTRKDGSRRVISLSTSKNGTPFATTISMSLTILPMSKTRVKIKRDRTKTPAISLIR